MQRSDGRSLSIEWVGLPWDVFDGEAVILDTRLHEGVGNSLPELLEDLGERLADALSGGGNLAAGEVVLLLRRELRFLQPPGRAGLRGEGAREARGGRAAEEEAGQGTGSHRGADRRKESRLGESEGGVWGVLQIRGAFADRPKYMGPVPCIEIIKKICNLLCEGVTP